MPCEVMLPCQIGCDVLRVGRVDRGDRLVGGRRRVEGVAVGREAALVAVAGDGRARLQDGVAAVLAGVVDRHEAGVGRRVAEHRGDQPALLVEHERLVRREHRQLGQRVGLHRLRRVGHVEHDDARRVLRRDLEDVEREQQRGVVVGALVARLVRVAQDLEAARVAVVADLGDVAVEALAVGGAGGDAALDVGLGLRTRPCSPRAAWPRRAARRASSSARCWASGPRPGRARRGRSAARTGPGRRRGPPARDRASTTVTGSRFMASYSIRAAAILRRASSRRSVADSPGLSGGSTSTCASTCSRRIIPCLGSARPVPCTATGMSGTPCSTASSKAPSLKSCSFPSRVRVPSGKNRTGEPCAQQLAALVEHLRDRVAVPAHERHVAVHASCSSRRTGS